MNYFLFRKLEYNNKKFYQFYEVAKDFKPNDDFTTFDNRDDKDFFYVREDRISINDKYLYYIFEDANGTFKTITDVHVLSEVYDKFKEKYEDLKDAEISIIELKPVDEIVERINEKVKYQKDCVSELVRQIYRNQKIMGSDLPVESKRLLRNNVLLYGPRGHGKKEITTLLGDELNLPYAYVEVPLSLREGGAEYPTREDINFEIARQMLERSHNDADINNGIVFISEDYEEKIKALRAIVNNTEFNSFPKIDYIIGGLSDKFSDSFVEFVSYIVDSKPFKYRGHMFDFGTMTFIVSYDKRFPKKNDNFDITDVLSKSNCDYIVPIKELTDDEKVNIITSPNGLLMAYRRFLARYDRKLMVSRKAIEYLVKECNSVNTSLEFLIKVIEHIIKFSISEYIKDVYINFGVVKKFCSTYLYDAPEEVPKEENEPLSEIVPVYQKLREKIVGQDKGLKNLLYNIIENRRMANKKELEDPKQYIKNILVRGESGGGKTFIINNIARILNIPCFIADATQYTEAGYVGADVTDMLVELYHRAGDDLESAQKGILVIDEIDKKATSAGRNTDVSRAAVLNSLLKIIEGAEITIDVGTKTAPEEMTFDTSRLTVICSGAFEGIEEIRDLRIKKLRGNAAMGFNNAKEVPLTIDSEVIDKDFVEFGMMRQFMARIPVIVNLEKNTKESLKNIMINSSASALKIEKTRLYERGIELEFTDDFYDKLAEEAMKLDVGVRGIDKVLQKVLTDISIQDIDSNDIEKIILNSEVLTDSNKVILIPRQSNKVKRKVN